MGLRASRAARSLRARLASATIHLSETSVLFADAGGRLHSAPRATCRATAGRRRNVPAAPQTQRRLILERAALTQRCQKSQRRRNGRGVSERCLLDIDKHNSRARAFLKAATSSNRHAAGSNTSRADNLEPISTTRRLQRAELAWRTFNKQQSTSFSDWLEQYDPYLAWLRTTAPHLHIRRSSRGPRPSQVINSTLERSPINTQKHKAFPSQLPQPRDNFDKDSDLICDGGAGIFCSPLTPTPSSRSTLHTATSS